MNGSLALAVTARQLEQAAFIAALDCASARAQHSYFKNDKQNQSASQNAASVTRPRDAGCAWS